ncbi:MAG: WYL domain-containing protein [Spirochaetaceae bacterium]|nr:WYL domain-containing protein [Spirochaetaceae bacterium]
MEKLRREEKVKNQRIIMMDVMIRDGTYPSVKDFRKKFETSRSTIMRDLAFIRDRYQAPLEYDPSKKGYYYSDKAFSVSTIRISEGELFTLCAMQPLMEQYKNTPLENSINNVFKKILELCPTEITVSSSIFSKNISFISDPLPKIDENVFYNIFECLREKRTIEFDYNSIQGEIKLNRRVDPYHIVCQKGNWYLLAFCHKNKSIRTFSLARMSNSKKTDLSFFTPQDFSPTQYFDINFGIWNNKTQNCKIELVFDKSIKTLITEHNWYPNQEIKINPDGSVYLSFESNQLQEIQYWIMSFGSKVKVINPVELRETIIIESQKTLEKYNS